MTDIDIIWKWSPVATSPEPIEPTDDYRDITILNAWRRPRLMSVAVVCSRFRRSWKEIEERIADGRLPFTLVEEQQQLWIYQDEWDEWVNDVIVRATAPLAAAA